MKVEAATTEALHINLRNIAPIEKQHQPLGSRLIVKMEVY